MRGVCECETNFLMVIGKSSAGNDHRTQKLLKVWRDDSRMSLQFLVRECSSLFFLLWFIEVCLCIYLLWVVSCWPEVRLGYFKSHCKPCLYRFNLFLFSIGFHFSPLSFPNGQMSLKYIFIKQSKKKHPLMVRCGMRVPV